MTSTKVAKYLRSHVVGLMALFIALSGTAVAASDDPTASSSAVTDAKFKKLKKRVAALESKGPIGPAGGDLAGTYPNPTLRDASVTTAKIGLAAVTKEKFFAHTTANFDFPALSAGDCAEFPFVIAGVLPTDVVIVTPPETQPEGVIVQAQAQTGANTVSLQRCAVEAVADSPAANYKFTIIR